METEKISAYETLYQNEGNFKKNPLISLRCVYPRFTAIPNEIARNNLNQELLEYANSVFTKADILTRKNGDVISGQVNFQITNLLALTSVHFEGSLSAQTTIPLMHNINFDPVTGQHVTLYRLWEKLCTLAESQKEYAVLTQLINQKLDEMGLISKLKKPLIALSHNQSFYLKDQTVILTFSDGKYFSSSMKIIEVPLAVEDLLAAMKKQIIL